MIKKILLALCLIFSTGHAANPNVEDILGYHFLCNNIAETREKLSYLNYKIKTQNCETFDEESTTLLSDLQKESKWHEQKLDELRKYLTAYKDIHSLEEEYEQLRIEYAKHNHDEQTLKQKMEITEIELEAYGKKTTLTACERYDREAIEEKKLKEMGQGYQTAKMKCQTLLEKINEYNEDRKKMASLKVQDHVLEKFNLD